MFTMSQIKEFISNAKLNGACDEEIEIISTLKSVKEIINHEKAPYWAYWYACFVIKGRWPKAEEIIKTDPEWAYLYARDVINGRWVEGEEIIKTSPEWAYRYAKDVIEGRWPVAEEIIKTSPEYAYWYDLYVIMDI